MKNIILFILLCTTSNPGWSSGNLKVKNKDFADWQGTWSGPKKSYWTGHIEINKCKEDGCDFHFLNGNIATVCEASGRFSFVSHTSSIALDVPAIDNEEEKKSLGVCRISFNKDKSKITLAARGKYCASSCGMGGSGPFGGVFTKEIPPSK
jgi:hypothetical protein